MAKQITPDKKRILNQMRIDVAALLAEIEDVFINYSLPITGITLIARDPANDKMIVVLTNEDQAGKVYALNLALTAQTSTVDGNGDFNDET